MTPIQQMYLGLGAKKKTYLDDVFSTHLWTGTGSSNTTITNNIDLSGQGGLVWIKNRESGYGHGLFDTVRGVTKQIKSDSNGAESVEGNTLTTFLNNGFKVNGDILVNQSTKGMASFSFRKAKGFFDVISYTGNGSNRTIAHSLGSVPGMIFIKRTNDASDWIVYHQALDSSPEDYLLNLNSNAAKASAASTYFQSTAPTSSVFSLGSHANVNGNGETYVAYVFAGGESTAATARSVDFDGTGDVLSLAASDDFHCTGDVTIECWVKPDGYGTYDAIWGHGMYDQTNGVLFYAYNDSLRFYKGGADRLTLPLPQLGQWTHIAMVRSGSKVSVYMNGTEEGSYTDSDDFGTSSNKTFHVGSGYNSSSGGTNVDFWNGKISNFRFIKGTAVYTSSFRPPTEPLTSITNTTLLCCNDSSTTGKTTGGTITANGDPTASTDSPFDDPAAFTFGENGDENIIKTGSYTGNGNSTGPEINLGWEPQWILLKNADEAEQWQLFDSMRGIIADGNDEKLMPSLTSSASTAANIIDLTPTGFKLKTSDTDYNGNNDKIIYIAIRRPDGYVGKPAEAGTDVFTMDMGNNSPTIPAMDSGFPVDFALIKKPASTFDWYTGARLTGSKYMKTNSTDAEATSNAWLFDSNAGWSTGQDTDRQSYMWKRHAGFDVVTYDGNGVAGRQIPHSMNKTPEMIWIRATGGGEWIVGHHKVNGGTNPWNYEMLLHDTRAEGASANKFNNTAPTSSVFTVGDNTYVNATNGNFISMLFCSVSGISKVGSYTGNGVKTGNVQTLGFQPRFILIKSAETAANWWVFDTTNGIVAGNENFMSLNTNNSTSAGDYIDLTSDGFDVVEDLSSINGNNKRYIYYAHA